MDTANPGKMFTTRVRPQASWPMSWSPPPFGALPTSAGMAREHVRAVLAVWGMTGFGEPAEYVTSELIANAVNASTRDGRPLHDAAGILTVRLTLRTDGTRLRVEVGDRAPGIPAPRAVGPDATSGRGLAMVSFFSRHRWGWTVPDARGWKVVYAELSLPVPDPGT